MVLEITERTHYTGCRKEEFPLGKRTDQQPFSMVPEWVLFHPKLNGTSVRVYALLWTYTNSDNVAWPSRRRMADQLACGEETIRLALVSLEEVGAITRNLRPGRSTEYFVHWSDPQETLETPAEISGDPPPKKSGDLYKEQPDPPEPNPQNQNAPRPRDPHWDALVAIFGPADGAESLYGKMAAKARHHPVEEIPRRAEIYMHAFDGAALTLPAFVKHWSWLGSQAAEATVKKRSPEAAPENNPAWEEQRQRLRALTTGEHHEELRP